MTPPTAGLDSRIRRGLAWSAVNNLILRLGSLALGIVLARLLTPEQFGVYAVALTVQTVLMTLADLGLSADLIRSDDPAPRAPTVATFGLCAGAFLSALMALGAPWIAGALGSPEAAPVISALSLTLVLAGAGVVPYAMLLRRIEQKRLFGIAVVDFVLNATVTVCLILAGWGVMALAVGRIVAQAATLVLQFVLSGERPTFGFDRRLAPAVLAFGLPVAGANVLSWGLLGIDKMVLATVAGPAALGYYVLAFNISTWPMTAVGQVVRSVAMSAFARVPASRGDRTLARAMAPTWALAVAAGVLLAALALPLVRVVYGDTWTPAAAALAPLALFGAIRVAFDLMASYLLARGASVPVMWVQVVWFLALVPALVVGSRSLGIVGAGWAQLAVSVLIVLPAYLRALHGRGTDLVALGRVVWPPLLAGVPAFVLAGRASAAVGDTLLGLVLGGLAGLALYGTLLGPWLRRRLREATFSVGTSAPTRHLILNRPQPEPGRAS